MTRILGIDPGSRITGFGVIEVDGQHLHYVTSGCIRTGEPDLVDRLRVIFEGVNGVIREQQPDEFAIERVFVNRNADSALKLGQARGAALVAGVTGSLPVFEYSATQVKQALVGRGHAGKGQIQHMVRVLLALSEELQEDAADALAVAICHGHTRESLKRMNGVRGQRGGRYL